MAVPVGVLLLLGIADTRTAGGQVVLVALGFAAQFLAGHLAARLAGTGRLLNGGLSAITLYAVAGAMSIAAGEVPGPATLAFGAAVALLLGTAAGVLVEGRNQPR